MNYTIQNGELYHYGVKGMKWGRRMARGHAGPGQYLTKKRQLAGDKRDLERLNKGEHLSVGLTKKRQAAYDARDRKAIEKRIAKNESLYSKPTSKLPNGMVLKDGPKPHKQPGPVMSAVSSKKTKQKAADALDKLDDIMFFKGDKIPNNFAIRAGMRSVSNSLRNNESFMNAAVSGLEDYKFFKD